MMKTWKNKVAAICLMLAAWIVACLTKDCTALILFGFFAVPLFFAGKNYVGF
jgi:hypothetical protein